jgi:hypothetical protein
MCPPPSNLKVLVSSLPVDSCQVRLIKFFLTGSLVSINDFQQGPIPKFDPAFMVQALIGYLPHKAVTGQVMTRWDHNVRTSMENVMATAYRVAPVLAYKIDDIATPHP